MAQALAATFAPGGVGEAAVPTFVSAPREAPFPMATGRSAAWSTGGESPARRSLPPSVIAGLALAPLLALMGGGLVRWQAHRAPAPAASAPSPPPPATTAPAPSPPPPVAASAAPSASTPRPPATAAPRPPAATAPRGQPTSGDRLGL